MPMILEQDVQQVGVQILMAIQFIFRNAVCVDGTLETGKKKNLCFQKYLYICGQVFLHTKTALTLIVYCADSDGTVYLDDNHILFWELQAATFQCDAGWMG